MAIVVSDRRARLQESPLRHLDPFLFGATALLAALGTLMVYASTRNKLEAQHLDPLYFVKRQIIAIIVGIVVMVVLMFIDYRRLRELSLLGYGATILMLLAVLKFGASVNGAQARFDIGAFQLQPGEFAKIFLTLVLAAARPFGKPANACTAVPFGSSMTPAKPLISEARSGIESVPDVIGSSDRTSFPVTSRTSSARRGWYRVPPLASAS